MRLFDSITGLFKARNRVALSRYPSKATPDLRAAWKRPQTKYTATIQPYTSPLTMYGGNSYLNGETWEMRREYREWSFREPPVKAALLTKCLAVASLDLSVTPDNPESPQDCEAASWVEWALTHAAGGVGGLVQSLLLPGLIDGYSMLEPVWDEVDGKTYGQQSWDEPAGMPGNTAAGKKYAGFWTVSRYAQIDTEHIRFKLDEYRQVIGVRPMTGLTGYIELPPEDYLIFSHLKMFENPFGISDLRAIVRDARAIEEAIKLRRLLLANFSAPFLKAMHKDLAVQQQIAKVIERARGSGFIVVPEGTTIDVVNLATSSPDVFNEAIAFYREQIVMAITGSYLQLLAADAERGSSMVAKSVAELFVWWLALEVCEVINRQLVPSLVRPNYGNAVGLPRTALGGINTAEIKAAIECFKSAQDIGWVLSKRQVGKVGMLATPSGPEDELHPPQQANANPMTSPESGGGGGFDKPSDVDDNPFTFKDAKPIETFAVEWKPYTNPDDGRQGVISPAGQVRYDIKPTGTQAAVADAGKAPDAGKGTAGEHSADAKQDAVKMVDDLAKDFPAEAANPTTWGKVKDAAMGALARTYLASFKLIPVIQGAKELFTAVYDTPEDIQKKFGINPAGGTAASNANQDVFARETGVSFHLAANLASKALAAGWAFMKKRADAKAAVKGMFDDDTIAACASWVAETFNGVLESFGQKGTHTTESVAADIKATLAAKGKTGTDGGAAVKMASGGTPSRTFRVEFVK